MSLTSWLRRFVGGPAEPIHPAPTPRQPQAPASPISSAIPQSQVLTGPNTLEVKMDAWVFDDRADYPTEVVGEAYRIAELWRVREALTPTHHEYIFDALLVPEPDNPHDSNAVAVYAADHGHVGYIKRAQARRWGPLIQDFNRIARRMVACKGIIRGDRTLEIFLNIKITDIQKELDLRKLSTPPTASTASGV